MTQQKWHEDSDFFDPPFMPPAIGGAILGGGAVIAIIGLIMNLRSRPNARLIDSY